MIKRTLLCPFQIQGNILILDDCPYKFELEVVGSRHYIFYPRSGLEYSLALSGMISYLPVRITSQEDIFSCDEIKFTCGDVAWAPNYDRYEKE